MENTEFRRTVAHADGDGGVVYETRQDVSGIIEQNRKEFNQYDERSKWSDDLYGNKVASIPLTVIDDLNKQGIMRGFHVLDEKKFRSWLNHPDNRFFRTRPGNI
jgi:hypothetical protein